MPHADGTLTAEDHAKKANEFLHGAQMTPQEPGTDVVCALIGIGHALLALHEDNETRRRAGLGY